MRVLAITKIFPNSLEPLSSPFNRQQFGELAKLCDLTVLAAIPYVPLAQRTGLPERAAKLAVLPEREVVAGIETHYVRQLYVPRVGIPVALPLYLASLWPFRTLAKQSDIVLGTWAYPDGCAATVFARSLGKPSVVKVHGSDLNVVAKMPAARSYMRRILPRTDALVSVARPLSQLLEGLGARPGSIHLVRNGVDTSLFRPRDRGACRDELGIGREGSLIVFCGRLEPQKGLAELLAAFDQVRAVRSDVRLALLGDGVSRDEVRERVSRMNGALIAPGARPLREIATWVGACDLFTLPSHNEGTPNVVLEALASGRPVVGSDVGGIPDCLADPCSGLVVPARDAGALARALLEALDRTWDPDAIVRAGPGSWKESARALHDVLVSTVNARR
ncbi:glycosyltransferase [Pendulispora albinea]|uniref:Glycosyltransferase n=1 Tax=Pendulispora albinea TaxID=2741071 RepID=A0ABZ2M1G8_9BACT